MTLSRLIGGITMYYEQIKVQDSLYLERIHLTPWKWWPFKNRYFIHIFHRADADRVLHDHPHPFIIIGLWGSYDEVSHILSDRYVKTKYGVVQEPTGRLKYDTVGFLSVRHRPADHTHRIVKLHSRRVVTFIIRGRKEREWGFWVYYNERAAWKWFQWEDYFGI